MVYKVKKDTVRKYYKVSTTTQTWTQPPMSANGSLGGDIFAVSSTNDSNSAYHAFDSTGVRINLGTITLYNPNPFCITKLVFAGRQVAELQRYVKAFTLYGSNNNSSWVEIQSFSGGSLSSKTYDVTNSAYYKYYKITVTDARNQATICNLTITATEQVTVMTESTASDYDIYKDVLVYSAKKESVRKYYKYGNTTNITTIGSPIVSNGTISGFSSSNYAKLNPDSFPTNTANSWEVVFKWTHTLNSSDGQVFLAQKVGYETKMGINESNKAMLVISNAFDSNYLVDIQELKNFTLSSGGTYYYKAEFTGTAYNVYLSTDGVNWILQGSKTTSTKASVRGDWTIGIHVESGYYHLMKGTIDLKHSYIKLNGNLFWTGTQPEESTSSNYDFYKDINVYKALKQ